MSAPSVPQVDVVDSVAVTPSGKNASTDGETLPVAPPPMADVAKAAERLNEIMSGKQRSLRFQVDEGSGRTIITVINTVTNEVIRQIPPEKLLAIARHMEDLGALIDARA
jgi:flagellar protein FlaG